MQCHIAILCRPSMDKNILRNIFCFVPQKSQFGGKLWNFILWWTIPLSYFVQHAFEYSKSTIIFICSSCILISSLLISILFALHVQFFEPQIQHVVGSSLASRGWIWCPSHVKKMSIQPSHPVEEIAMVTRCPQLCDFYGNEPSCCFGLKEAFGQLRLATKLLYRGEN